MIACCVLLGIWTAGLLWFTLREEKRRLALEAEANAEIYDKMNCDVDVKV